MAASTYLQIGKRAYEQEDWLAAISWLEAAKESATTGGSTEDIRAEDRDQDQDQDVDNDQDQNEDEEPTLVSTLDHLSHSYYKAGNVSAAITSTNDLLEELVRHCVACSHFYMHFYASRLVLGRAIFTKRVVC